MAEQEMSESDKRSFVYNSASFDVVIMAFSQKLDDIQLKWEDDLQSNRQPTLIRIAKSLQKMSNVLNYRHLHQNDIPGFSINDYRIIIREINRHRLLLLQHYRQVHTPINEFLYDLQHPNAWQPETSILEP